MEKKNNLESIIKNFNKLSENEMNENLIKFIKSIKNKDFKFLGIEDEKEITNNQIINTHNNILILLFLFIDKDIILIKNNLLFLELDLPSFVLSISEIYFFPFLYMKIQNTLLSNPKNTQEKYKNILSLLKRFYTYLFFQTVNFIDNNHFNLDTKI